MKVRVVSDVSATDEGAFREGDPDADVTSGEVDDDLVSRVEDLEVPGQQEGPHGGLDGSSKDWIKY